MKPMSISREDTKARSKTLNVEEVSLIVHGKQLLTYLRLLHMPVGLLMNFDAATFKRASSGLSMTFMTSCLRDFA